jgi:hypothetical protein
MFWTELINFSLDGEPPAQWPFLNVVDKYILIVFWCWSSEHHVFSIDVILLNGARDHHGE